LPDILPAEGAVVWSRRLTGDGLAGLVATADYVIVADRDLTDSEDIWRCLDAETGNERWFLTYPAAGQLDYGNSPRAAPLIWEGLVFLEGAFGHLHCVDADLGSVYWEKDLLAEFGAELPTWGYSGSPLIVDERLIINPGGPQAFLAALDPLTGETIWKSPGRQAAYASLITATLGGRRQLIGYDKTTLGGWSVEDGTRLWELAPPQPSDFNVPTPIAVGDHLLVSTENNGTRLYEFQDDGTINPEPAAVHRRLAPDTSTPVVTGDRVFGVWKNLYCLATANPLAEEWISRERAFRDYASLIAAPGRVLITTTAGELILLDAAATEFAPLGRLQVVDDESEVHSHPAIVGTRLYLRSATRIYAVDLAERIPQQ